VIHVVGAIKGLPVGLLAVFAVELPVALLVAVDGSFADEIRALITTVNHLCCV
jgi:hypothetical protein